MCEKKNERTSEFEEDFGWVVGMHCCACTATDKYTKTHTQARKDTKQNKSHQSKPRDTISQALMCEAESKPSNYTI